MSFEEFAAWLRQELRERRLSENQVSDLLAQRLLFDKERGLIETEFHYKVVGYIANERLVTDSTTALLEGAARAHPNRMLYFEPIGFRVF
jgi:hypothetical protein